VGITSSQYVVMEVCCYGDKPHVLDCFHSDIFLLDLNLKE